MSTMTGELAHGSHPDLPKSNLAKITSKITRPFKGKDEVPLSGGKSFDKSEFLVEKGTGRKLDSRGNRENGVEDRKAHFSEQLLEEYTTFMEGHIRNLLRLSENSHILDQDVHLNERRLLHQFSEMKDGKGSVVSSEKIREFVESPEGLKITTQLIEQQTALMIFGLGLDMQARGLWGQDPPGHQGAPESTLVNVFRKGIMRTGMGRMGHIIGENTLGRWGGLGGALVGGVEGAAIGRLLSRLSPGDLEGVLSVVTSPVTLGAAVGAGSLGALSRKIFHTQGDLDLQGCSDGLAMLQGDPDLLQYVKAMTGIDANDFIVNANNHVAFNPAHPIHETQDIEGSIRAIAQNVHSRHSFYEALGFPRGTRTQPMEQMMTRYNDEGRRQLVTIWGHRQQELLDPNNPIYAGMTPQQRLEAYQQARAEVLGEDIEKYVNVIKGGRNTEEDIKATESRVTAGKSKDEWDRQHDERLASVKGDGVALIAIQAELANKPVADGPSPTETRAKLVKERTEAIAELKKIEASATGLADIPLLLTTARGEVTAAQTELDSIAQRMQADLDAVKADPSLRRTKYGRGSDTVDKKTGVVVPGPIKDATWQEVIQDINAVYALEIGRQEKLIERVEQRISRLETVQTTIEAKDKLLGGMLVPEGSEPVRAIHRSYNLIIQVGSHTLIPINQADLVNETISTDELLRRVNEAHGLGTFTGQPGEPWPQHQNENYRRELIEARIEARVRRDARLFNPTQERQLQDLMNRTMLDEVQIRTMEPQEIVDHMTRLHAANPRRFTAASLARVTPAAIAGARDAAKMRVEYRNAEIASMQKSTSNAEKGIEAEKGHFVEPENVRRGEIILDLARRQSKIYSESTREDLAMVDLFDDADALPTDNLTEQEIAMFAIPRPQIPRGHYQFLNFLFDYQSKGSERGTYFEKIQSVLNPQRFTELVQQGLLDGDIAIPGIWIPGAGFNNIQELYQELHTAFDNGDIGRMQLRQIGTYLIDQLLEEGRALHM